MTVCNAVHPQAEQLAAAGVTLEPCALHEHPEGRHVFLTSAPVERPATIRVVLNLTPEQWESDAVMCSRGSDKPRAESRRLLRISAQVDTTQEHLGVPVGVVVRTYTEGGDDAA